MNADILQAAEAFSGHDFEVAFDALADTVEWDTVGGPQIAGRDDVIRACRDAAEHLATAQTTVHRTRTINGDDHVIVDSVAEYVEPGDSSTTVGSCDIYAVADNRIVAITSYNVEVS